MNFQICQYMVSQLSFLEQMCHCGDVYRIMRRDVSCLGQVLSGCRVKIHGHRLTRNMVGFLERFGSGLSGQVTHDQVYADVVLRDRMVA